MDGDMAITGQTAGQGPIAARRRLAFRLGLVVPGAGQLVHGDGIGAAAVALGVAALWLYAALELLVPNQDLQPTALHLLEALRALRRPLTLLPDLVVLALMALSLHVGAAWLAGSARFGRVGREPEDQRGS